MTNPTRNREGQEHFIPGQADDGLGGTEAHLRHLLVSTRIVPWVANAYTWRFTYVGTQISALLGYPCEQWYENDFWVSHLHPDDREGALAYCLEHSKTCREYEFDYRMISASGQTVWIRDVVTVETVDGAPSELRGFFVDITERKAAEAEATAIRDQLAHVSRLASLGELATTMAHEVNQPLTAIAANAQASRRWMNQEPLDRTELTATLDDIAADALRAGAIIRRLRALVEKQPSEQRPVDLNTLVQDVVRLVAYDLPLKAITFRMDLAADLPAVTGDRVQLQQVLLNLLLNAIEAIVANGDAEGSKIELRTVCTDGGVAVEVADNGVGFDPARAATIFDPFVTTKAGGLGMGLSIGRTIAAAHGGRLWATRNAERGATFHLSLPVASAEPEDEQVAT